MTDKPTPKTIGAAELAKRLKVEPVELRKFLRANGGYAKTDGRYAFTAAQAKSVAEAFTTQEKIAA